MEEFRSIRDRVVAGGWIDQVEVERVRKDGSRVLLSLSVSPIHDPSGRVAALAAILGDVTERKRAERELERSRSQLAEARRIAAIGSFESDVRTGEAVWSDELYRIYGLDPKAASPGFATALELVHPDDRAEFAERTRRSFEEPGPHELRHRIVRPDGSTAIVRSVWRTDRDPSGRVVRVVGTVQDVTEAHQAEEALREAEARFRSLVERLSAVVYMDVVDPDDPVDATPAYISPQIESLLGYTPEEWIGDPYLWGKVVHPEDHDHVERLGDAARLAGEPFQAEYRMLARDGRVVWVREESVLIRDAAGRPAYWQGIILDVTERKAAEEALARQEEWFRKLTEHSSDIVFVVDADHIIRYVSPSVTRVLGWSPDQALGTDVLRLAHQDDREAARSALDLALSRPAVGPTIEARTRHRDGSWRWMEMIGTILIEDPAVRGLVVNARDVTERRAAEDALRQSESELQQALAVLRETDEERRRLIAHLLEEEAVERGRMAEGIEDRSLQDMAAVGMRLEALRRGLSEPGQVAAIDKLRATVEQALGRLKQVLVELHPRALERDGLTAALEQYLRATFPSGMPRVAIESRLAGEPAPEVRSIAYRVAKEAIASAARFAQAGHVDVRLEGRGGGVLVRVIDDGMGFRNEDLADDQRLGLSSMQERARLAGGWLRIHSEPGRGTEIEFWLPERLEGSPT